MIVSQKNLTGSSRKKDLVLELELSINLGMIVMGSKLGKAQPYCLVYEIFLKICAMYI